MAVFIELVTDAFEAVFRSQAGRHQGAGQNRSSRSGRAIARRPVRGIEIKEDTYAYLRVVMADGRSLPLLDSSSPDGESTEGYTNFILQSVQEERMEKHQIVETFGESYIFFFGESPRFLNITAQLINTHDFNWRAEWWHNYENYLRGTKLVELGARCYLFYDDIVIEGYILGATAGEVSEQPYQVSLQFRFFVTKYRNISLQNVQYFPLRSSSNIIEAPELTNADAFVQAAAAYRDSSFGVRQEDAATRQEQLIKDVLGNSIQEVPLPNASKISNAIASNPAIAFDPDLWSKLIGTVGLVDTDNPNEPVSVQPRQRSVRGLIAENVDEYMMGGDGRSNYVNELASLNRSLSTRREAERAAFEAKDLIRMIVENLWLIGCYANNPDTVNGLGLGPNFTPGYQANAHAFASASAGGGAVGGAGFVGAAGGSATASFSPVGGFGATAVGSASAQYGVTASAQAGFFGNASLGSSSSLALGGASGGFSYQTTPLSAVYGASASASFGANVGLVEGVGDLEYGYSSEFGGAGYGQAGYGDFGGNGFGGASSSGDPGFLATAEFSFSGVGGAKASYSKFTKPKQDNTALTGGPVFGGTSLTGKGSVNVGGSSSAFAIVSVEGSIEGWAVAEAEANGGMLYFGPGATASAYATAGVSL